MGCFYFWNQSKHKHLYKGIYGKINFFNNKKKPIHTTFLDNINKNNSLPNQNYGQSEYTLEVVEKLKRKTGQIPSGWCKRDSK